MTTPTFHSTVLYELETTRCIGAIYTDYDEVGGFEAVYGAMVFNTMFLVDEDEIEIMMPEEGRGRDDEKKVGGQIGICRGGHRRSARDRQFRGVK